MKGVIFDLDGVLVFTDKYHYKAWKSIADELGIYFDEEINKRLRGVSRMDSLNIILERYEGRPLAQAEKDEIAEKKNSIYREYLKTMTADDVTMEVRETLTDLKKKGLKLALGSSSKNAKMILSQVGLEAYLDAVSDGTNITKSKPSPEVFLKAAEFLGLSPEDCVVVEDAEAGIDAAKAGGMMAAGIGDAAGYQKTDIVLNRFSDLKEKIA